MQKLFLFFPLLFLQILCGCQQKQSSITTLSMLEGGATIAVPTGTVADQFVLNRFPDAEIVYFNSVLDCALAVKDGKADAAAYDKPILKNISSKQEGLTVLDELLIEDEYGFAVRPNDHKLKKAIDETLASIQADGTYDEMQQRWFPDSGEPGPMPNIENEGKNGVLRFGTAAVIEPMSYYNAEQEVVGFDIEFARYIAQHLGMKLEIVDMEFGGLLPALISGKIDMAGAGMSITEERAKMVLFSECYYPSGIAAIVRSPKENNAAKKKKNITSLSTLEGGATIAVPTGTVADQFVLDRFPDAEIVYFNSVLDCALAVKDGKADAAAYDKPILKNISSKQDGLTVLDELLIEDEYGFAVRPNDHNLKKAIDETLASIQADGTYDEMQQRWFPDSGAPGPMPKIENEGKNGVLRFGTAAVTEPMSYYNAEQEVVGFDIEFASYIAKHLGMKLEIVDMEFGGLLPALISGKIDMAGAGMSITEERAKMVLFSECYYPSGIAAIVRTAEKQDNTMDESDLLSIDNIDDKKMGTMLGSIHGKYARENYPDAKILQFQTVSDMLTAIKAQKIDVAFFEDASLSEVTSKHSEIGALKRNLFTAPIAAAFNPQNDKLKAQYNTFLKEIKANGVYDDVYSRWIEQKLREQPEITVNSPDGKLTVGISSDVGFPYMGMKDGRYIGFDVELAQRFASYLGKEFVLADMPFSSLIAALSSGKIDLIHSSMMITDERKEKVDFSDVYFESGCTIIALNKRIKGNNDINGSNESQQQNKSFFKSLSNSFYNNIVRENRYKLILNGLKVTSIITLLAALLGTIIGSLLCFLRMSKNKVTANVTSLLIDLVRGTPVLVFLMITFYVIFASVNIDPVIVAVIAFGINFGAYVSEMFRSAIGSIDPGQREAGIASGFTKTQTFIHIILPQALQRVLPVYKGEFISLLKMTSIVGYIAVQDLTKASDIIRSRTFDAFFPLIMAAVIYIALAALLTWGLSFIEVSVDPKRRKIKKTVEGSL